jgi:hypothetical protein
MRVVERAKNTYTLQDLVTLKLRDYHVTQLKQFHYDNLHVDPVEIARQEQHEFEVSEILGHRGDAKAGKKLARTDLEFWVRWKGFDESYDSWEPWDCVKDNQALNMYLYNNKLKSFLTKEQKLEIAEVLRN